MWKKFLKTSFGCKEMTLKVNNVSENTDSKISLTPTLKGNENSSS